MPLSCSNAICLLSFLFLWLKSEYVNLKETLGAVTQERDLALLERNQLQGKLENLEQVLKVRNTVLKRLPMSLSSVAFQRRVRSSDSMLGAVCPS